MRKYTFVFLLLACLPFFSMGQSTLTLGITGYDAKCNGSTNGSAKVTVSGGVAPYSYIWTPAAGIADSVSSLAAGIYSVTVTDSVGNIISGSVTINQPAPLTVVIDSIVVFPCFKPTGGACGTCANTLWAVVSGGTAPYSYFWTPDGYTTDTLQEACYVDWTVNVTDNNNCVSSDSLNVIIPQPVDPTQVAELRTLSDISLYPNPANNQLNISINQAIAHAGSLAVYDMMGRKVIAQKLNGNERLITIDVSRLTDGNYLLMIAGGTAPKTSYFSVAR